MSDDFGTIIRMSDFKYAAKCPNCGGLSWELAVNGPGNTFTRINSIVCSDCRFGVDIEMTCDAATMYDDFPPEEMEEV